MAESFSKVSSAQQNFDAAADDFFNNFEGADLSASQIALRQQASDYVNNAPKYANDGYVEPSFSDFLFGKSSGPVAITGKVTQPVANIGGLASQGGKFSINASQITNGFSDLTKSVSNVTGAIADITGLTGIASSVNNILDVGSSISELAGRITSPDQLNSVVSNITGTVTGAAAQLTEEISLEDLNVLIGEFNIEEFATNTLQVIPREAAELAGAVGGEFDRLKETVGTITDGSGFDNFFSDLTPPWDPNLISGQNIEPVSRAGLSRSKIPNPLRNHNGFNYVITLGCLSQQENNFPEIYREKGGFDTYVIQSSGGNLANRYQVLDETVGSSFNMEMTGAHAEYYIDDLEIDAVIAPNPNTTVTPGSRIKFTVHEPYSMGNFIQAIVGSAQEKGFPNAIRAPFCLRIDFAGWNEGGQTDANFITKPMFIPISIYQIEFNVSQGGSVYTVEATSTSEAGLSDAVNKVKTTINAVGTTVYEVLNGEDRSVSSTLNQRIANLEEEDVLSKGDRYIIAFPRDLNGMKNAIAGLAPGVAEELTQAEQVRRERGLSTTPDDDLRGGTDVAQIVVPPSSQLFDIIESYARDQNKMNKIGRSIVVDNTAEGGDQAQGNYSETHNPETDTANRGSPDAAVAEKAREHKFQQGETVTSIIEKVVLRSRYAADHATEESNSNGTRQWFKIETQVYIDSVAESERETGQPAKIYVYNVIPYYPDEAKFLATQEKPANTQQLMDAAVKEYNYIYTGVNEDVLDFDLNFNQAFTQTVMANYGQNSGASGNLSDVAYNTGADVNTGAGVNRNSTDQSNDEPGATIQEQTDLSSGMSGGGRSQDIKLRVAEMFHDRLINQIADLVSAEMRIFGDPYWITQQTGNYVGESVNPNLTQDGTVNYMNNEVFVVINFKTPFDYQVEGATMEMPRVVNQFSGLFSCWAVTHSFSKGKFEQTLKLTRRRGQDDEPTTGNKGFVDVDDSRSITDDVGPDVGYGAGQIDPALARAAAKVNSTTGSSDPCETTKIVEPNPALAAEEDDFTPAAASENSTSKGNGQTFQTAKATVGGVTYDGKKGVFPAKPRQSSGSATTQSAGDNTQSNLSSAQVALRKQAADYVNNAPKYVNDGLTPPSLFDFLFGDD